MITFQDLTFSYADKNILRHFSMELPLEGITALTGPSGCGKTTLLRLLSGLERPRAGHIDGIFPGETAFLFQENRLLPWRTTGQQITDILPRERRKELPRWLAFAELEGEADTPPDSLSGGMARRLALARCAALGGRLLLLDEPFTGVDQPRRERLMARLREMGTPVILASHEKDVLERCDRVYRFDGPPLRLL